jgi:hypothetical protein
MEIQALRVIVTQEDLTGLATEHLPENVPVEKLRVEITPEGVRVRGEYPLFVSVSFEALWLPRVGEAGKLEARLVSLRALGMPASVLKSVVLNSVARPRKKTHWVHVKDDTLVVDVDRLLEHHGLPARTNLQRISCQLGHLILEAGNGN